MIDHRSALRRRMQAVEFPAPALSESPLPCRVPASAGADSPAGTASSADPFAPRSPGALAPPNGEGSPAATRGLNSGATAAAPGKNPRRGNQGVRRCSRQQGAAPP
jgi:hypothetical protein